MPCNEVCRTAIHSAVDILYCALLYSTLLFYILFFYSTLLYSTLLYSSLLNTTVTTTFHHVPQRRTIRTCRTRCAEERVSVAFVVVQITTFLIFMNIPISFLSSIFKNRVLPCHTIFYGVVWIWLVTCGRSLWYWWRIRGWRHFWCQWAPCTFPSPT